MHFYYFDWCHLKFEKRVAACERLLQYQRDLNLGVWDFGAGNCNWRQCIEDYNSKRNSVTKVVHSNIQPINTGEK